MSDAAHAIRGSLLDLIANPFHHAETQCVRYWPDGLLVVENGHILALGDYADLRDRYAQLPLTDYSGSLILPGLIDLHVHYPQTEMIASYGEQLLGWLQKYTFPTERKFQNYDYARHIAAFFLEELLKNGTTTALVLGAVFPASVDAFFTEAQRRRLRMIAGKVMMDRLAPDYLLDTAESAYRDTKRLIQQWHGRDRLLYAITPRFAASSTPAQLAVAGKLRQEFPDVYLHTHLSENQDEVRLVRELYPGAVDYLDVYDQAGLVGARSIFAHGIYLNDREWQRLSEAGAAIAHCPTSNLFIGSGLFACHRAQSQGPPVKVGVGTDVGGGTSFSLFQTLQAAYNVAQLQGQNLTPFQALYLATLGGATALSLQPQLGNLEPGKEADFIVVDRRATPLMALRNAAPTPKTIAALAEQVFATLILGDDRAIQATYILGDRHHPLPLPAPSKEFIDEY